MIDNGAQRILDLIKGIKVPNATKFMEIEDLCWSYFKDQYNKNPLIFYSDTFTYRIYTKFCPQFTQSRDLLKLLRPKNFLLFIEPYQHQGTGRYYLDCFDYVCGTLNSKGVLSMEQVVCCNGDLAYGYTQGGGFISEELAELHAIINYLDKKEKGKYNRIKKK